MTSVRQPVIENEDFICQTGSTTVAPGWSGNPESMCRDYAVIQAKGPDGECGGVQIVRGWDRSAEYVWQKFDVVPGQAYVANGTVKTVGGTSAQIRLFYLDEEERVIERCMSEYVLADSDWTTLYLTTTAPAKSRKGLLFAISFTAGARGESHWWRVEVSNHPLPRSSVDQSVVRDSTARLATNVGARRSIVPRPKECIVYGIDFHLTKVTVLRVPSQHRQAAIRACHRMQHEVTRLLGKPLSIQTIDFSSTMPSNSVIACLTQGELNGVIETLGIEPLTIPNHPEGYVLVVKEHVVLLAAETERGLYYATQTLVQLFRAASGRIDVCSTTVRDWPDINQRIIHMFVDFSSLKHMEELIFGVIGRLKFNAVVLECSAVRWKTHSEIWQQEAGSTAELSHIVSMLRDAYLEVVPLVQSLGHCAWLFHHGHNLDLCEDDTHPYAYNPLHDRSYEVLFDIYEEAIDLFQPRSFHIGHDEVRMIGEFPKSDAGKRLGFAHLFTADTTRIAEFLLQRNVRPWMWADVVCHADLRDGLGRLPPELVMVDWQYTPFRTYDSTRQMMERGFEVIGASWWNEQNIRTFAKYIYDLHATGMMQTTWTGHFASARWREEIHQYKAHVFASQAFWSAQPEDGARARVTDDEADAFIREALTSYVKRSVPTWGEQW